MVAPITDVQSAPVQSADDQIDVIYDRFVAHMHDRLAGRSAPRVGTRFPSFTLPSSTGCYVQTEDLLGAGPVVLNFMRGSWCPYCRQELEAWHDALPRLMASAARFIAISPEVGGRAEETRCSLAPQAEMLCDVDMGVALSLGLAVAMTPDLVARYGEEGLDLASIYGGSGYLLPIPATYVLDRDGVVRYAFVEPDFRVRSEPGAVISLIEALASR